MPPKPSNVNIPIDESDPQSSCKRKCPSSRLQTHPSPPTSAAYFSAYEDSMKMFQAATNSITKQNPTHGASKSMTPTANPGPTSASMCRVTPLPQSSTKRVSTMQAIHLWQLYQQIEALRPRYHQNAPSSEPSHLPDPGGPSMFSGDIKEELAAGGGNVSSLTSPKAVKEPFIVQYPLYARDLDRISVEQKLSRHVHRRAAAAQRWNRDVIPGLIRLYMEHIRESQRGQLPTSPVPHTCSCNGIGVMKQVTAVYMDHEYMLGLILVQKLIIVHLGLDYVQLRICPCAPAPVQLVKQGLFPCSPVYPALAVSLDMLEFVSTLFVHLAPNETAWADALTSFLARPIPGPVLSRDPDDRGDIPPETIMLPIIDDSTPITNRLYISALSPNMNSSRSHAIAPPVPNPDLHTHFNTHSVLSDYLHSRCPLCFGGDVSGGGKLPNFFLCLDACFAIRRNKDYDRRPGHKKQPGIQDPCIVPPGTREIAPKFSGDLESKDGDRVKTPGECFSDTGVMAGVCRHDRVVMWANMWTPGEQQFYALNENLSWSLGQLLLTQSYSQLQTSFMRWVCQLWYKSSEGGCLGLTDGEGSNALWNDLRHLIQSPCRCLVGKRVKATKARLIIAQEKRARIPLSDEFLQSQFEEQRAYQSRPLERQSKKKGFLAVEKILAVHQRLDAAWDLVEALQKQLIAIPVSDTIATWNEQEDDLTAILKLGDPVSYDNLKKMKDHPWFEHQLNMRALKARILAKACQRNFEAHNLTDHSTAEHTNKALKRRYRSIKNLVTDYNKRRLIIPPPIEMKGLFSLDVDNDIWQDIGLADDEFGGQVPPWLGDEDVRNGIQIVQEIMNCHDELYLCECEQSSLQHWFNDESAALIAVLQASKEDADLQFFLWEHAQWLIDLGKRWGCSIDALAPNVAQSEVGQSEVRQMDSGPWRREVDSSDDDEEFELEPQPVIADPVLLAATDLLHEGHSDDMGSSAEGPWAPKMLQGPGPLDQYLSPPEPIQVSPQGHQGPHGLYI
ncbi:hypothetical protein BS47DRAFT_1450002 [Hydnum rufescens UP504]|uniref:CxC1-like cysteine cluster associated with KDZ transposases domain-containing protein n=1 Tax=Hydnum rufescens UP504 TaxID=1448309 RepID=A0A9P6B022_9AGAM|nr:hypothetical protein BS47DRAFT_1450002 [Hydnum rufescens UP504]